MLTVVMVDAIVKPYVTFADYLEAERSSDIKHEWFNGAVYAMSRGTPEHARLSARIVRLIGNALPADCEVYSSDMMLYLAEVKLSTYADGSVVCGPLETITVKRNGKSLGEGVTNPVVIIEVLSESTERYDREEKFGYYRTLPSLQEFVLVAQDDPVIEVFRRPASDASRPGSSSPTSLRSGAPAGLQGSRDGWDYERARAGGTIMIHGCTIAIDAVYGTRG
jgi:Uma2 family endonuclease